MYDGFNAKEMTMSQQATGVCSGIVLVEDTRLLFLLRKGEGTTSDDAEES